jgi:hypothetical protein
MQRFINNWITRLSRDLKSTDKTLSVPKDKAARLALGAGDFYLITLFDTARDRFEIVKATAISAGDITIERGQEDSSAQDWSRGTQLSVNITAATLARLMAGTGSDTGGGTSPEPDTGGGTSPGTGTGAPFVGVVPPQAMPVLATATYYDADDAIILEVWHATQGRIYRQMVGDSWSYNHVGLMAMSRTGRFVGATTDGQGGYLIADVEKKSTLKLTGLPLQTIWQRYSGPQFGPDDMLYGSRYECRINPVTGERTEIKLTPDVGQPASMSISPDGKTVAFGYHLTGYHDPGTPGGDDLYLRIYDTQTLNEIDASAYVLPPAIVGQRHTVDVSYSPDNHYLALAWGQFDNVNGWTVASGVRIYDTTNGAVVCDIDTNTEGFAHYGPFWLRDTSHLFIYPSGFQAPSFYIVKTSDWSVIERTPSEPGYAEGGPGSIVQTADSSALLYYEVKNTQPVMYDAKTWAEISAPAWVPRTDAIRVVSPKNN